MSNPYEDLANAIIQQAVKDYRDAKEKLKKGRKNSAAKYTIKECTEFFESDYFMTLTDLDGKYLLRKLQEEDYYDGEGIPRSGLSVRPEDKV